MIIRHANEQARGEIFGKWSVAGWLQGVLGERSQIVIILPLKRRDITHTAVHFRERLHTFKSTKGQSGIQVNQVVAVAVKILDRFMHGRNRFVCNNREL